MPITIRKIELFCSLLFFSPTSLQRAKNACFSLIFPKNSAFRNGFELRRSDVKKDFFFNIFRRRSVESSSDNFRFFPINTVSCDIYQKTRNQFDSNVTWVRIPPSAPKTAPCGVLSLSKNTPPKAFATAKAFGIIEENHLGSPPHGKARRRPPPQSNGY